MWLKKHKWHLVIAAAVLAVLAAAFFMGGSPSQADSEAAEEVSDSALPAAEETERETEETDAEAAEESGEAAAEPVETPEGSTDGAEEAAEEAQDTQSAQAEEDAEKDAEAGQPAQTEETEQTPADSAAQETPSAEQTQSSQTSSTEEAGPVSEEDPQPAVEEQKVSTITISISCRRILDHMEDLDPDKQELVPADGVILAPVTVSFEPGEDLFTVFQRVVRTYGIQMEFTESPAYGTAYIEGIAGLYEKDCGSESGWMYHVNGTSPNYGCSQCILQDGDTVEWIYSCALGEDMLG